MNYIYAVLYHAGYTSYFFDCMRRYVKISFTKHCDIFNKLSKLGEELAHAHLLDKESLAPLPAVHHHYIDKDNDVVRWHDKYDADTQTLHINDSLKFIDIEPAVFDYVIGGYRSVIRKYLHNYKHDTLDIYHFEKIIKILRLSLDIERRIAEVPLEAILDCYPAPPQ